MATTVFIEKPRTVRRSGLFYNRGGCSTKYRKREQMKVFLSWSGDRSKLIAEKLKEWLPNVIQVIDPWISTEDVDKGNSWLEEIKAGLIAANGVGIFCVTRENMNSPWLNFEAGYLAAAADKGSVCVVTLGLGPAELLPPLSLFQATNGADKDDFKKLISTLNRKTAHQLQDKVLDRAFESQWLELDTSLKEIAARSSVEPKVAKRSSEDMFAELITLNRRLEAMLLPALKSPLRMSYDDARAAFGIENAAKQISAIVGRAQQPLTINSLDELRAHLANPELSPAARAQVQEEINRWINTRGESLG
ncbi:MAG: TIR domain-containing protein [Rubrivivax sp.]|nr:MAG: TIR domain-containing protein [Rubrivivax sp.]